MKWLPLGVAALATSAGCGSDDTKVVFVSGTIIAEGKPLAEARVAFMPEPGNKPETPGTAATGPDGKYIVSWNEHVGIAPGKYRVIITGAFVPPPGVNVPPEFKDDPFMLQLSLGQNRTAKATPPLTGEFDATVTDSGSPYDFDLKPFAAAKSGSGQGVGPKR